MMREIKFRAWDVVEERMRIIAKLDFPAWIVCVCDDKLNYQCERNSFRNQESDKFILMQYTGLKDKNGVEIYEGDIVKVCGDRMFEIVYSNGCFNCKASNKEFALSIAIQNSNVHECDLHVIGNIFENPQPLDTE